MNKKLILILIILFSSIIAVNAQQYGYIFTDNFAFQTKGKSIFFDLKTKTQENSNAIYLYEKAFPGNIKLQDNKELIAGVEVKYDLLNKLFEVIKDGSTYIIPSGQVVFFKLNVDNGVKTFINSSIFKTNEYHSTFFEVLEYGKLSLLKETDVVYREGMGQKYGNNIPERKYIKKETMLTLNGKQVEKLKKGKKSILNLFGTESDSIHDFCKKNDLSYKKEHDLVKIFNYYNQLHNTMSNN